jgi:hypothetical protein
MNPRAIHVPAADAVCLILFVVFMVLAGLSEFS